MNDRNIESQFALAKEQYQTWNVDVEQALALLKQVRISLHCWQGDDVGGFENPGQPLADGLAVTGNYPGKARTIEELRQDLECVYGLLPGQHRLNLHAFYGEYGNQKVDRDAIGAEHFAGWIAWAKEHRLGLDFNPTYFSHPLAKDGFTLSHRDKHVRHFWIEHGILCRRIGAAMGQALGTPCVTNFWIPDGYKDTPIDRTGPRERLRSALDEIFHETIDDQVHRDAVEAKLFGIGSESYTTGSHEFYLGYAVAKQKWLCLDAGHFHPTESIADKISSVMQFVPGLLLHVSRGVRWDSDHVVTLSDDLVAIAHELVRGDFLSRVAIGLDFFDASINRIAAWTIGSRNTLKAILFALLEPTEALRAAEKNGDFTTRLAWVEDLKTLPWGSVWDYYCLTQEVPTGGKWLERVREYEQRVLSRR